MKNLFRSLSSIAGLALTITVLTHNALTGTIAKIDNGTIDAHVTKAYTSIQDGTVYVSGRDAALAVIRGQYRSAYLCASKKDLTKCRSQAVR